MSAKAVFIFLLLPVVALAGSLEKTEHLELSTEGIQTLKITCGAGFLRLSGVEGRDRIRVTAHVIIYDIEKSELQNFLDNQLVLMLKKRGTRAILHSDFKNKFLLNVDTKINLTIVVPQELNVKVDDGSGSLIVTDLHGNLEIEDDSGSIEIKNIAGNVKVEDGTGEIIIEDIGGKLKVKDGSGSIRIDAIRSNVSVIDGSGSMIIEDVTGNVTVTDGSGNIEIYGVAKNVYIKAAGSGDLEIEGVKGKVTTRD